MGQFIDRTGMRYGRLTVIRREGASKTGKTMWLCCCDCGVKKVIRSGDLTSGKTISCGCYHKDAITKHGLNQRENRNPLYVVWNGMISRCENPKSPDYKNYGGRGIRVCKEWHDVRKFVADMYPSWGKGLQLDRINNDGDYSPENCRWVSQIENANNKRNTRYALGYPVSELARLSGIKASTLRKRIYKGWSEDELLLKPSFIARGKRLEVKEL